MESNIIKSSIERNQKKDRKEHDWKHDKGRSFI